LRVLHPVEEAEVRVVGELLEREHLAPVGRSPAKHDAGRIELVGQAAREDHAPDAEAGQDLRQLRRVAEAVREVAGGGGVGAEPFAHRPPEQQVADERLGADEELVRQHVARADLDPAGL